MTSLNDKAITGINIMTELSKGQKTQEKIIRSAIKLFSKVGFDAASIQMIADDCDISQSAVFQHFKSKKVLLEAVRGYVSKSNHSFTDGRITMDHNAFEALSLHMQGNLEWTLKHRAEAQIILLTYYFGSVDKDFTVAAKRALDLGQERILKYVKAGQREKLFKFSLPAEIVAESIHDALLGMCVKVLSSGKKIDSPLFKQRAEQIIQSFTQN